MADKLIFTEVNKEKIVPAVKAKKGVKRYVILLEVDQNPNLDASYNSKIEENVYLVSVKPSIQHPNQSNLIEITAHELGHVLGDVFKTDAAVDDPRYGFEGKLVNLFGYKPEQVEREIVSEKEAWNLGEKMVPIAKETRDTAIGTYEQHLEQLKKEVAGQS